MSSRVEGLIGGVLVLLVVVAAVSALMSFPAKEKPDPTRVTQPADGIQNVSAPEERSLACQCFDGGYSLAGSGVDVLSAQYRTGYEQCRALADEPGAQAWTDGWNARLSANSHQARCPSGSSI